MNGHQQGERVINLALAPGERSSWGRPVIVVYAWALAELIFVSNPIQISSRLRVAVLKFFGAQIGVGVIFRPRTRVKFPWKLKIGDRSWIGEGVWIHNQDQVSIGDDVAISQDTLVTTGSHAHRNDMALITRPIIIENGVWVTSKSIILGGVKIGKSSLVAPLSVVYKDVIANSIVRGNPAEVVGKRFPETDMIES